MTRMSVWKKWSITSAVFWVAMLKSWANTPPTPVVLSAAMREGTTLMDITYRVDDPDDATVSAYPLAFVDGTRSFAKIIRPTTFEEGTAANMGTNVPANVTQTLVWNVAADWEVDLGEVKVEIICKDSRSLLPFDWLRIPAAGGKPELTISKNAPTDDQLLNALLYLFGSADSTLSLASGILSGSTTSGAFSGVSLADGTTLGIYAAPFLFKKMNLDPVDAGEVGCAEFARSGILDTTRWHAASRDYTGVTLVSTWSYFEPPPPGGINNLIAAEGGFNHLLALTSSGGVAAWGWGGSECNVPAGLTGVTAVAAGSGFSVALKSDGTVVAWGVPDDIKISIPPGLKNVVAISAGQGDQADHTLALKSDGTVVAWGYNNRLQTNVPLGLTNVIAVAAGDRHSLALRKDGSVVGWGDDDSGMATPPEGLTNVKAIAAGRHHSLALKMDGTLVAWGDNSSSQTAIPPGLDNVVAIAAGSEHCLALKSDGTVVAWGDNNFGQTIVPPSLTGVSTITAGGKFNVAIKPKLP